MCFGPDLGKVELNLYFATQNPPMPQLLQSPWSKQFATLVEQAENALLLCTPYITKGPCERIVDTVTKLGRASDLKVSILTDLSRQNMISGYTDPKALHDLTTALPKSAVRFLPSLHAKVYVADDRLAIVTSGNLTDGAMFRNFEYGVWFDDEASVRAIRADAENYASLGSLVDVTQLLTFAEIASELRELSKAVIKTAEKDIQRQFDERLNIAEESILLARTAGRTAHAIFSDAVLYVLRNGPLPTKEIHEAIKRIHPDLCDDTVDRVINEQHFGKKWKHAVRTAQQHLRSAGKINLADDKWSLV